MNVQDPRQALIEVAELAPSSDGLVDGVRRRVRRRRNLSAVASVAGLVAITVLGVAVTQSRSENAIVAADGGDDSTATTVDLPTGGWDPAGPDAEARFGSVQGVIRGDRNVDGGCVWLESRDGGRQPVVWPVGYRARFGPRVEIFDNTGQRVAGEGDLVGFGGAGAADPPPGLRCMFGAQQVAFVESQLTVVEAAPR